MGKLINKLLRLFTFLTVLSLFISYLAVWISPAKCWIPAFFGLAYPYILLISIVLLVFLFLTRKKTEALVVLVVIILGLGHLNHFLRVPFKLKNQLTAAGSSLKNINVMTYNVRLFNLYSKDPGNMDSLFHFIRNAGADVICLQEIYTGSSRLTEKMLIQKTGMPYSRFNYLISGNKQINYGLVIFSRFPITATGSVKYPDTYNATMYCDILYGKDTLRIFNNHLQSTRLKKTSKLLFPLTSQSESMKDILDISERLRDAFRKRAVQAVILKQKILESPYRVIVCGDFNDTPVSYTYHKISSGMKDAFLTNGKWLGTTYAGILPSFRIDYILTDATLQPVDFHRYRTRYSDHFPVASDILILPLRKEAY